MGKKVKRARSVDDESDDDSSSPSIEALPPLRQTHHTHDCVCRKLNAPAGQFKARLQTHVQCIECGLYFHGRCVGITGSSWALFPPQGKAQWACPSCSPAMVAKSGPKLPFCTCRCETHDTRWLVCCSVCLDVFHGQCVGATTTEHEKTLRSPGVSWTCAKCSTPS